VRFGLAVRDVVVGEGEMTGMLPGGKGGGSVSPPRGRLVGIEAAVIRGPVRVPAALVIRDRIIPAGLLAYPKHRCHDVGFPGVAGGRVGPGSGRDKYLWLDF